MFDTLLVKQFTINNNVYYLQIHSSYYEKFLATGEVKCIDEEIPFEIPQGWEWCRMGNIIELLSGQDFLPEKYNSNNKGVPYITGASNINNGELVINRWTEYPSVIGKLGDLLIVCKGSGIGKMCFCNVKKIHIARQIQIIRVFSSFICFPYLKSVVDTNLSSVISNAQGVIPGISREHILNLIIPIPPFNTQQRIVEKLKLLQPLIQLFDNKQKELESIDLSIKELLKKSILQEAIQGKLVPQIAGEGTAQELLEQIQQEKQNLVKEGKLKKSALTNSFIYKGDDNKYFEKNGKIEKDITNEIPFEIPDTWAWSRLSNLVILLSGRDLEPTQYNSVSKGIPYMTGASNFRNGSLIKNRWTETPIVISILGDLLITCKGTIGEMSFNTIGDIHIARQIMALRSSFVNLKYIQDYLSANIQDLQKQANSMIPGISRDTLLNALVPLPPLIEQARIVSKIKQLASIMRG